MRHRGDRRGFTLVEVTLTLVIIGILTTAIGGIYVSGVRAQEAAMLRVPTESYIRSAVERAIATDFDKLATVFMLVPIGGTDYPLTRTVTLFDINGDGSPDANAKLVTVDFMQDTLRTIVVDTKDKIEKIP